MPLHKLTHFVKTSDVHYHNYGSTCELKKQLCYMLLFAHNKHS